VSVVALVVAGLEELGELVVRELTGKGKDHAGIEEAVKRAAREAFEAAKAKLVEAAKRELEVLGLAIAFDHLGRQAPDVLKAFDPPEHPTVPPLGLNIEQVDEITEDDRKAERLNWDNLKTPPEGSSTR
jgi:hypothetical protein